MPKRNTIAAATSGSLSLSKRARNDLSRDTHKADVGLAACEISLQHGQLAQVLADGLLYNEDGSENAALFERDEDGGYSERALKIQAQFKSLSKFAGDRFKVGVEFLHVAEEYMRRDEASAKTVTPEQETPIQRQAREAKERAQRRQDAKRNRKTLREERAMNGASLDEKAAQAHRHAG